jgi:hypothetical protein
MSHDVRLKPFLNALNRRRVKDPVDDWDYMGLAVKQLDAAFILPLMGHSVWKGTAWEMEPITGSSGILRPMIAVVPPPGGGELSKQALLQLAQLSPTAGATAAHIWEWRSSLSELWNTSGPCIRELGLAPPFYPSRSTALLLGYRRPVCPRVAPCRPGGSTTET